VLETEEDNQRELDETNYSSPNESRDFPGELREYAEYLKNTPPSKIRDDALMELEYLVNDVRNYVTDSELGERIDEMLSVVSYLCDANKRIPKNIPRPVEFFKSISFVIRELKAIAHLIHRQNK